MAVLATVMALAVPSLSRSLRDRNLAQEAKRFIALTEYARNEAISQGVPMTVWIDVENGRFGAEPKTGFSGNDNTQKEFSLNPDVHFENLSTAQGQNELSQAIEFAPDGVPEPTSIASIELADRFGSVVAITKTQDKLGYEIEDASAVTNKK